MNMVTGREGAAQQVATNAMNGHGKSPMPDYSRFGQVKGLSAVPEPLDVSGAHTVHAELKEEAAAGGKFSKAKFFLPAKGGEPKLLEFCKRYQDAQDMLLGVDITLDRVRICEMRYNNGQWKVKSIASHTVETPASVQPLKEHKTLYAGALDALVKKENIKSKQVALAIPVGQAIVKTISLPLMSDEDIERAIAFGAFWENFIQLPDDLSKYSIHYEVIQRQEEKLSMDILFVAAKHELIKQYTDIVKAAGLQTAVVDVRCFSVINIMQLTGQAPVDQAIAFVKLDADDQFMYVSDHGQPFVYELFLSDEDRADLNNRLSDHGFIQRLSSQIKQITSTHESMQGAKERIRSVRLLHSASFSKGLARKLDTLLPCCEVALQDMTGAIDLGKPFDAPEKTEKLRGASVVMGLAMRKLDAFDEHKGTLGRDNVNLLPHVENFKKTTRVNALSRLMLGVATLLVVAVVGGSFVYLKVNGASLGEQLEALVPVEADYNRTKLNVDGLKAVVAKMDELEQVKAGLKPNQQLILQAYEAVYGNMPSGLWLSGLTFKAPNQMEMEGSAVADQHILQFIRILSALDLFEKVSLKTMQTEAAANSGDLKAFKLTAIMNVSGENK